MMSSTSPRITSTLFAMTSCAEPSARPIFSVAAVNQSKLKAFIQHVEQTVDPGPNSRARCLWVVGGEGGGRRGESGG